MAGQKAQHARTCIGCGSQLDKRQMLRVVRTPEDGIAFDPTGRAAGRGAYVCSLKCLERAFNAKKIGRALKTQVGHEDVERIAAEMTARLQVVDQ